MTRLAHLSLAFLLGAVVTAAVGANIFVGYRAMTDAEAVRLALGCCPELAPNGGGR